jgi:excisionase family DNA binding protein
VTTPDEHAAMLTVPALLSVATVAAVLDCSTRTVRRRIHNGQLPAVIEGERTMIRGDDLAAYINNLTRPTDNPNRRQPRPRARAYDFLGD